jgi:hypothetical protein
MSQYRSLQERQSSEWEEDQDDGRNDSRPLTLTHSRLPSSYQPHASPFGTPRTGLSPTLTEVYTFPSSPATLRAPSLSASYRPPTANEGLLSGQSYHPPPASGNNDSGVPLGPSFATAEAMTAAASLFRLASELPGSNDYIEGHFRIGSRGDSFLRTGRGSYPDRASNQEQGKLSPETDCPAGSGHTNPMDGLEPALSTVDL